MPDVNAQESEFARLQPELPFDDGPHPETARALREQALARFDQTEHAILPWWKRAFYEGKEMMRRPIPQLITGAAACLTVAAAAFWHLGGSTAAAGFNQIADAVIRAKTAHFQMEVTLDGQTKQTYEAWYRAPGKYRMDMGSIITISDFTTGKMLTLITPDKRAMVMNIEKAAKAKLNDNNYFERLRELLSQKGADDKQYVRIGEKVIDGKRAVGFRFDSPAGPVTLWGDPKTELPIRIENSWNGQPRTEVVMSNFEFNMELKDSLFDQTPPDNYKVQSLEVDASAPREQDLVAALKLCVEFDDGVFPDSVETTELTRLVTKYAMSHSQDVSEDFVQGLMKKSIVIGRGFQFAFELPASAEATYAGKGVKRDAKDTPIFWFKPAGANDYHVINADLTIHDAKTAPQVAGAVRVRSVNAKKPAVK